jgi:hypothetical protein
MSYKYKVVPVLRYEPGNEDVWGSEGTAPDAGDQSASLPTAGLRFYFVHHLYFIVFVFSYLFLINGYVTFDCTSNFT